VNIVAFQSVLSKGKGLVRFVVDDPARAKKTFDNEGLSYQETDIAEAKLSHPPGELARAASRLGEADINIDYAYCGVDPKTNTPLLIFGVVEGAHPGGSTIRRQVPGIEPQYRHNHLIELAQG
jgi:hypothetical protein